MLCIEAKNIVANTISNKPMVVSESFNLVKNHPQNGYRKKFAA